MKVVLSASPGDTLQLHTSVLTKQPSFFAISLGKLDWLHNKTITEGIEGDQKQYKLLELDFEDRESTSFPLLIGKVSTLVHCASIDWELTVNIEGRELATAPENLAALIQQVTKRMLLTGLESPQH